MKNHNAGIVVVASIVTLFLPKTLNTSFAGPLTPKMQSEKTASKEEMNIPQNVANRSSEWKVLSDRENEIDKAHNVWIRELVVKASPMTQDARAKAVASQEDQLRNAGILSSEAKAMAVDLVDEIEKGSITKSNMEMLRIGSFRKAEVTTDLTDGDARVIDTFDGVKEGHFQYVGSTNGTGVAPTPDAYQWVGAVSIDTTNAMDRSANAGLDILLMQMPVEEIFALGKSDWQVSQNALVLTTKGKEGFDLRLTLSKQTGCPISLERLRSNTGTAMYVHRVTQTKFFNGIELPSEIVSYQAKSGSVKDYDFRYNLKSSKLNSSVDSSAALLPSGTEVSDFRLGSDKAVSYKVKDGRLLPDADIEKLYGENQKQSSAEDTKGNRSIPLLLPLLGVLCVCVGGALWLKGSR